MAALLPGLLAGQQPEAWLERESYLMGTLLHSRVAAGDRDSAAFATEAALAAVRRLEGCLSTWDTASTLGVLNRAPVGVPSPLDTELASLLATATLWQEATAGAFHPVVGALVDAWDLRGAGRVPHATALAAARRAVAAGMRLDAPARTLTRLDPAAWIDTGAFGKGAALAAARDSLVAHGVPAALLNFGGQVLALGAPAGEAGWTVPVADPARRERAVAELRLRDVSAATTGASERFIEVAGERFGHVLDPRTGLPVAAWGSVTVVHPDPLVADILSTALFVMGPAEGMTWARARPDLAVLMIEQTAAGPAATWSLAMTEWLASVPTGGRPAGISDPSTETAGA